MLRSELETKIVGAINSTAKAAIETTKTYIWEKFGSETNLIAAVASICTTILGFLSLLIAGLAKFWTHIKDCSCCLPISTNVVRRFTRDVELGQVEAAVGREYTNYRYEGETYSTPRGTSGDADMNNSSSSQA